MVDEFGPNSAAFLSWLSNSGATVSSKIEIADLRERHAGRGVGTPKIMQETSHDLIVTMKSLQST
jgi:N-lysine methyltransferase SETD6